MAPFTEFIAPETAEEAAGILRERGSAARLLAGGTDLMVRLRRGLVPSECTALVGLHRVGGMRGCRLDGNEIVVGAAITATDLIGAPLLYDRAPILGRAADRMASAQVRNVATLGGNLANASPAGDLIIPLLLLDARLVLLSAEGRRTVAVEAFFTGPGETVLGPGELIVEVRFDAPPLGRVFRFEKAGRRPAMECSVLTVGLAFTPSGERMTGVRVAFGSAAPTPLRGVETEALLEGEALDEGGRPAPELVERAVRIASGEVRPISDVRGSERYRRALAGIFLGRMLRA